jgi:hypothetical protein
MTDPDQRFWPYKPQLTLAAIAAVLVGLLLAVAVLRALSNWPSSQSETGVLIGILLLSLLPLALALLDVLIDRGGSIKYGGVEIDFARSKAKGTAGIVIASNIGVPGQLVFDSTKAVILDALDQASASDVVVVDLEDGQAWWETRLLVLLAGAVRLGKPDKIVFLGKDANIDRQFRGWARASDLLPRLAAANPQYARSLHSALAAARQWELVEPMDAANPADITVPPPPMPAWMMPIPPATNRLATAYSRMAFDQATGMPDRLFAEKVLLTDLNAKLEEKAPGPRRVTLVRLDDLFRAVLNKDHIDLGWPPERQLDAFLNSQATFVATTRQGTYTALVPRAALTNEVLRSLTSR